MSHSDPRCIAVLEFNLVEDMDGSMVSRSMRFNVQVHQQAPGARRGGPPSSGASCPAPKIVAEGWVDTDVVPTSDVKLCTWRSEELWNAFWGACRDRMMPHLQPHKYPRYSKRANSLLIQDPRIIEGAEVYSVYEIVGFKMSYHRPTFHVAWVDYPDTDNTWEPLKSLKQPLHTFNWTRHEDWIRCCNIMAVGQPHLLPTEDCDDTATLDQGGRPLPPPRVSAVREQAIRSDAACLSVPTCTLALVCASISFDHCTHAEQCCGDSCCTTRIP